MSDNSDEDPELYRKLLEEFVRRNGVKLMDPSEFRRWSNSIAHKIGEDQERVHAALAPIIAAVAEDMVRPSQSSNRRSRKK